MEYEIYINPHDDNALIVLTPDFLTSFNIDELNERGGTPEMRTWLQDYYKELLKMDELPQDYIDLVEAILSSLDGEGSFNNSFNNSFR